MTKLPRDAKAFATRVMMGTSRLWLLVEGRVHDRPFYDRLLSSHIPTREQGYSIRLGEQIKLDGVAAGGKDSLLALHRYFEENGLLEQANSKGKRTIALAVDRDFDHLIDTIVTSSHLIYTSTMDVESEILLNGDVRDAASAAYSLTREKVDTVIPDSVELASQLAALWREWIVTGAAASCCGLATGVRFARRSNINVAGYGAVVSQKAEELRGQLAARLGSDEERSRFALERERIDAIIDAGAGWSLVKGKWIAGYVWHLITTNLPDEPRDKNTKADTLAKTCLPSVNFSAMWTDPYRAKLDVLVAA
jgi:hypothetical protein